ncbi:MAG: hypothetical protein ABSG04_11250 [Verrucomicrobiota bacterium]|jgi:hypothetical protein
MKNSIHFLPVFALATAILTSPAFAQLSVPSDGSDGALNITSNTVIDLSQAVTGTWSANNAANAGKGIYDAGKWAVVFKYSSVSIASGATLTFANHYSRAPVVWLVQSGVTINGTVSVNGNNGTTSYPELQNLTEPGPGGFRGGAVSSVGSGDGLGPGGGVSGVSAPTYQTSYGNPQILPLIGGSGTAQDGGSGGSGAGAILIVAAGTVSVNGAISAYPGASGRWGSLAAGGGIRVVANQISGNGIINAAPQGRTRMEANSISSQLNIIPNVALVSPGTTPVIWPPASAPTVSIVSVGGQPAPTDPVANVISSPDIGIQTNSPVTVLLQTQNFPIAGAVALRLVPVYGPSSVLNASYVSGNTTLATWQLTAQIPVGYCVLQAHATAP